MINNDCDPESAAEARRRTAKAAGASVVPLLIQVKNSCYPLNFSQVEVCNFNRRFINTVTGRSSAAAEPQ